MVSLEFYERYKSIEKLKKLLKFYSFQKENRFIFAGDFMPTKEKIFNAAQKLFMSYGFRSVSMDDIAKELSVSKKTLYIEFKDKNQLVEAVVVEELNRIDKLVDGILESDVNPIQQLFNISKAMIETRKQENPNILYDLKKYHPSVFTLLIVHRDNRSYKMVLKNLINGKNHGFYRADLDEETIAHIYINTCFELYNPKEFTVGEKSIEEIFKNHLTYHIHGIISEKGLKEFNKITW